MSTDRTVLVLDDAEPDNLLRRSAGKRARATQHAAPLWLRTHRCWTPTLSLFLLWVDGVNLLLPNATELAMLTGSTEPKSAAELLGGIGAVAVTTGKGPR